MKARIIFGPPGTGKTEVLMQWIGRYSKEPNMAILSFSKAAAKELTKRTKKIKAEISTIHALAFKLLGLSKSHIVNEDDFIEWVGGDPTPLQSALHFAMLANRMRMPWYDLYKARRMAVGTINLPIHLIDFINKTYKNYKDDNGLVDFDDMIIEARDKIKFDIIIIDEAQDMSAIQWNFVFSIMHSETTLIVAGDDDQAIYSWAGADPHGMSSLKGLMPYKNIGLEKSYRLPQKVFNVAMATIKQIKNRELKNFEPTDRQGYFNIATKYDPSQLPESHLVLCRDRFVLREIENELIFLGLPYAMEGIHGKGWLKSKLADTARAIVNKADKPERWIRYCLPWARGIMAKGLWPDQWETAIEADREIISYLERVDLDTQPKITISTIHAQKGREANHIVVIGDCSGSSLECQDRLHSFEDEIRVWYTALTRAKEGVTLVNPYSNPFIIWN